MIKIYKHFRNIHALQHEIFYLGIIFLPISNTISGMIFLSYLFNKNVFKFNISNLSIYKKIFILFVIYNILLGLFSVNLIYHYVGLIGHYIVYIFFYKILVENKFNTEKIINSILLSGIILSFISYLTFIGFKFNIKLIQIPFLENEYLINLSSLDLKNKASGLNMNPNILSIYLVLTLTLSIKKNNIYILIIQLLGIFLTSSRGGILALSVVIVYVFFKHKQYIFLLLIPFIIYKLSSVFNLDYSTNIQRLNIWSNVMNIVKDYPLGIGIMNFDNIYKYYQYPGERYLYHVHNWYLQVLLESGIIGFFLLFFSFFKYILNIKDDIIKLSLISFSIFSITDYVLADNRICFIIFLLIYLGEKINNFDNRNLNYS